MIGKYSLILGILLIIEAHSFYSEFPGPFCAKRTSDGLDGCCDSRKDDCAVPIAGKCVKVMGKKLFILLLLIGAIQ